MEEDNCRCLFAFEVEKQLHKEHDAEVAIINAARKVVEEREAIMIKDSSHLREMKSCLISALSDVRSIEEAEITPPCLALVSSALAATGFSLLSKFDLP
ncbi:hypothetical protein ACLOJK_039189 [Asimina triloba]